MVVQTDRVVYRCVNMANFSEKFMINPHLFSNEALKIHKIYLITGIRAKGSQRSITLRERERERGGSLDLQSSNDFNYQSINRSY